MTSKRQTSNTLDFINKAIKKHGNKYDYSKSNYISSSKKVIIKCYKHGEYLQTPNDHLSNEHGCPKCAHIISHKETEFLDFMNIKYRNIKLKNWERKPVDGYNPKTNTIYEFLGDYWHGNPERFNPNDIHHFCKKTYGQLYENTFNTMKKAKSLGYNVKYIWETDWLKFKHKKTTILKIQTL